jgi:uncharacterized protein YukE
MTQDIHQHLEKLKTELQKLAPAVKLLQTAEQNSTALVGLVNDIHKEYTKHLQSIEKLLIETNKTHHKNIDNEIQKSSKKLTELHDYIDSSFNTNNVKTKNLLEEYEFLSSETYKLVEVIQKVDFPVRLENIDTRVQSIKKETKDIQQLLAELSKKNQFNFSTIQKDYEKRFEKSSKDVNLLKILLFVILALVIIDLISKQF